MINVNKLSARMTTRKIGSFSNTTFEYYDVIPILELYRLVVSKLS